MNKLLDKLIVLILLLSSNVLFSQIESEKDSISLSERYIIFEGDTLLIELDEINLLKKLKFDSTYDRRYYYWFRKKTLKAYPFAKLAGQRVDVLNQRLEGIKSRRKKKQYTKRVQKYLEEELTSQLKN